MIRVSLVRRDLSSREYSQGFPVNDMTYRLFNHPHIRTLLAFLRIQPQDIILQRNYFLQQKIRHDFVIRTQLAQQTHQHDTVQSPKRVIGNCDESTILGNLLQIFLTHLDRHPQSFNQTIQKNFRIIIIHLHIQLIQFMQP